MLCVVTVLFQKTAKNIFRLAEIEFSNKFYYENISLLSLLKFFLNRKGILVGTIPMLKTTL